MNDYQEYRSYGSYLSRVFAIIIAFLLLVFAIWGVVRLANDDDDSLGDTTAPSFSEDSGEAVASDTDSEEPAQTSEDPDLFVSSNDVSTETSEDSSTETQEEQGHTLSTNTDIAAAEAAQSGTNVAGASSDGLPATGASDFGFVLILGATAFLGSKYYFANQK